MDEARRQHLTLAAELRASLAAHEAEHGWSAASAGVERWSRRLDRITIARDGVLTDAGWIRSLLERIGRAQT